MPGGVNEALDDSTEKLPRPSPAGVVLELCWSCSNSSEGVIVRAEDGSRECCCADSTRSKKRSSERQKEVRGECGNRAMSRALAGPRSPGAIGAYRAAFGSRPP